MLVSSVNQFITYWSYILRKLLINRPRIAKVQERPGFIESILDPFGWLNGLNCEKERMALLHRIRHVV